MRPFGEKLFKSINQSIVVQDKVTDDDEFIRFSFSNFEFVQMRLFGNVMCLIFACMCIIVHVTCDGSDIDLYERLMVPKTGETTISFEVKF